MLHILLGKGQRGLHQSLTSCDPQSHKDRLNLPSAGEPPWAGGVASREGQQGNEVLKPTVWSWFGGEGISRDPEDGSKVTCQGTEPGGWDTTCVFALTLLS